jgi:hypothetical protein
VFIGEETGVHCAYKTPVTPLCSTAEEMLQQLKEMLQQLFFSGHHYTENKTLIQYETLG